MARESNTPTVYCLYICTVEFPTIIVLFNVRGERRSTIRRRAAGCNLFMPQPPHASIPAHSTHNRSEAPAALHAHSTHNRSQIFEGPPRGGGSAAADFLEDGFLVLRNALDTRDIMRMATAVGDYIRRTGPLLRPHALSDIGGWFIADFPSDPVRSDPERYQTTSRRRPASSSSHLYRRLSRALTGLCRVFRSGSRQPEASSGPH